jgi:hypothetical protein
MSVKIRKLEQGKEMRWKNSPREVGQTSNGTAIVLRRAAPWPLLSARRTGAKEEEAARP